jgi:hypothetical protein
VPSTAAARTAVVSLPYRPTQTLTPQDGAGGVIITMSHASQQDRAKSPRRYKEEPAPVAAQLVSASLFTQLHDRCLPTQTRYPLAFRSSCMHQPSSAHRCCVNAAYRAILVTPAHARFWLHGRPPRQAAGFNPTVHYFIVPCRTLSSLLSCRGAPPFTAVESMLGALSRPSIVHRRAISFIASILVTPSFLEPSLNL